MIFLNLAAKPYTPPWYKAGKGPVFMIRAGDVTERELFEAELAGDYDAGRVLSFEMEGALERGTEVLLADAPDQLAALREMSVAAREVAQQNADVIEAAEALPEAEREAYIEREASILPDAQRLTIEEAERIVRQHWPDYRAMHQRIARRNALIPLLAFRHFCTGWDRLKVPFEAGPDGLVTAAAAGAVPPMDMKAAGLHAYRLLYAAGEEKNLLRPLPSDKGPKTSRSGARSTGRGGRSTVKRGAKTRA